MSVKWGQTIVMTMPPALTLLGVSTVLVAVDMMEMESTAQVSFFFVFDLELIPVVDADL